ncbi:uncharacterized protein LOC135309711 [Plodia interpunctella]|uniref:uncharacterized protein LOC135309711 n=1 Tax=Plodia interpunctella TaxID=58824 RepID=UPI0031011104
MSQSYYRENKAKLVQSWYCPSCANVTRRKAPDTPVRSSFVHGLNDSTMSCDEPLEASKSGAVFGPTSSEVNSSVVPQSGGMSYEKFLELFDARLDTKLNSFKASISQIIKSEIASSIDNLKADFSRTTDFLEAEQKDLRAELSTANDNISRMESDKLKLQSDINTLERRLAVMEKSSRSCNLEVQAVPDKKNENIAAICKKIFDVIGVPIQDSEICAARRVAKLDPKSDRPRNIIITLPSERHRDSILSAYKRFNKDRKSEPLNSSLIGIQGERSNIYLAEHLSSEAKELYAAARKFKRDNQYQFVWVKYGRVYLRKSEECPAIYVKNLDFLNKLKK